MPPATQFFLCTMGHLLWRRGIIYSGQCHSPCIYICIFTSVMQMEMQNAVRWPIYPMIQHDFWLGVGCSEYNTFHSWWVCGACVYLFLEVWTDDILYRFIEDHTHFGMWRGVKTSLVFDDPKWVALFIQIQTLPLSMHHQRLFLLWLQML